MGCQSSTSSTNYKPTTLDKNEKDLVASKDNSQELSVDKSRMQFYSLLEANQFLIKSLVQCGGVGFVYEGIRILDSKMFAFKLFGYTEARPVMDFIYNEIDVMYKLLGIDGVVQIEGVMMDTCAGLVPGKKSHESYPIIVMELLSGGELFDRIIKHELRSEINLANIIKSVVIALNTIHSKRLIHRDIKLENIMYATEDTLSNVKLIDCGMTVELKQSENIITDEFVVGTQGYIAPETIARNEYSKASDVWQIGCCLYTMLSSCLPFDPENQAQCNSGIYLPMTGTAWFGISRNARMLVEKILQVDPTRRPTCNDILQDPWIVENCNNTINGTHQITTSTHATSVTKFEANHHYYSRMKLLPLKSKLKRIFKFKDERNSIRCHVLMCLLPFLSDRKITTLRSPFQDDDVGEVDGGGTPIARQLDVPQGNPNANLSQQVTRMRSLSTQSSCHTGVEWELISDAVVLRKLRMLKSVIVARMICPTMSEMKSVTTSESSGEDSYSMDLSSFCDMMSASGLSELADKEVFDLLSPNSRGVISIKELLLTVIGWMPLESASFENYCDVNHKTAFVANRWREASNDHAVLSSRFPCYGETNASLHHTTGTICSTFPDIVPGLSQPPPSSLSSPPYEHEDLCPDEIATRLFHMLDVEEEGYLVVEHFKLVIKCLLETYAEDDGGMVLENDESLLDTIEDMYHSMDISHSGHVTFEQFQAFVKAIMIFSVTDPSSLVKGTS